MVLTTRDLGNKIHGFLDLVRNSVVVGLMRLEGLHPDVITVGNTDGIGMRRIHTTVLVFEGLFEGENGLDFFGRDQFNR